MNMYKDKFHSSSYFILTVKKMQGKKKKTEFDIDLYFIIFFQSE